VSYLAVARVPAIIRAAPIPASSGKVARHRLSRGGDRQANHAVWRIVITRMGSQAATRLRRPAQQGRRVQARDHLLPQRNVAREVYLHLRG
jgi:transposase